MLCEVRFHGAGIVVANWHLISLLTRKLISMTDEKVKRINELYHKAKAEGLTEAEKKEQAVLREEYVASFRRNLRSQLDQINIQNEDGSIENLGEKYGKKVIK